MVLSCFFVRVEQQLWALRAYHDAGAPYKLRLRGSCGFPWASLAQGAWQFGFGPAPGFFALELLDEALGFYRTCSAFLAQVRGAVPFAVLPCPASLWLLGSVRCREAAAVAPWWSVPLCLLFRGVCSYSSLSNRLVSSCC